VARLVKKDVLWCGRWNYPDGRTLTVKPGDIQTAIANGNKMLADRLAVKWLWEHEKNAIPEPADVWAAKLEAREAAGQWAKSVLADAVCFEMGHDHRGPTVVASIDADKLTPAELRQLARAARVSCRLDRNFREVQYGKRYPGLCISHIAVTPLPVELDQGPFQMSRAGWPSDETFFMGEGRFMADVPKKSIDDDEEGIPNAEAVAPEDPTAGAGGNVFKRVMAAMNVAFGYNTSPSVKDWESLAIALEAIGANAPPGEMQLNANPDTQTQTPAGGPMMMSQLEYGKHWPARVTNDREEIESTLRAMVRDGQIPRDAGQKILDDFQTFEMSYHRQTGKVIETGLVAAINTARKTFPKGSFINKKRARAVAGGVEQGQGGFDMSEAANRQTVGVPVPTRFTSKEQTTEAIGDDIVERVKKMNPPNAKM
jgi:hypothetical protein